MKKIFLFFGPLILTIASCSKNDDLATDNGETNESYPEGLIAYYPFNGNAQNVINFENNGLVEGAILSSDINISQNKAYLFNGMDNVIRINHNDIFNLNNEFTISVLVQPLEIKSQTIIRKGAAVNGEYTSPYNISLSGTGNIIFTVITDNGETANYVEKQGYETNKWYLITAVIKNSEMYLYVNGELEANKIINGQLNTNSYPLLIGSRLSLPSDTFKGTIDEVRIYNNALNEFDVKDLFNSL